MQLVALCTALGYWPEAFIDLTFLTATIAKLAQLAISPAYVVRLNVAMPALPSRTSVAQLLRGTSALPWRGLGVLALPSYLLGGRLWPLETQQSLALIGIFNVVGGWALKVPIPVRPLMVSLLLALTWQLALSTWLWLRLPAISS